MLSLDLLEHALPAYQVAGRSGLDVFGFVRPPQPGARGSGVWLHPYAELSSPLAGTEPFTRPAPPRVPLGALRDHLLVVSPRGEFLSTDEMALRQVRRGAGLWEIDLEITRSENEDGQPDARDLYVVLSLDPGRQRLRSLVLRFGGRWRDVQGTETALAEPMAEPLIVEFAE